MENASMLAYLCKMHSMVHLEIGFHNTKLVANKFIVLYLEAVKMRTSIPVSIIMYVKNGMPYFKQAFYSVINQTLKNIEIIVVDGGSTDGTLDIVKQYLKRDKRVKLLLCDKGSVGAQFNMGLKEAKGEYIGIVEADDYIAPKMYEHQYNIASSYDIDIVKSDYNMVSSYGIFKKTVNNGKVQYGVKVINNKDIDLLETLVDGFWSGIYRRKFIRHNNIRMNETLGASYQDITYTFLSKLYAKSIWYDNNAFYYYRINNANSSMYSSMSIEKCTKEYECLKNILRERNLLNAYYGYYVSWKICSLTGFLNGFQGNVLKNKVEEVENTLKKENTNVKLTPIAYHIKRIWDMKGNKYYEYLYNKNEENKRTVMLFNGEKINKKSICIFGAGEYGMIVYHIVKPISKSIKIIDNGEKMQGKDIDGITIENPDAVIREHADNYYIIANAKYWSDMREQLLKYGVKSENIFLFTDADAILRNR